MGKEDGVGGNPKNVLKEPSCVELFTELIEAGSGLPPWIEAPKPTGVAAMVRDSVSFAFSQFPEPPPPPPPPGEDKGKGKGKGKCGKGGKDGKDGFDADAWQWGDGGGGCNFGGFDMSGFMAGVQAAAALMEGFSGGWGKGGGGWEGDGG